MYRQTVETIRAAIGPQSYLLGCWGTPLEGAGIFNGSRTGGDVVLGWGGFQVALRPTLQYYYLHNIVWYCDPDVVLVRPPLSLEQARAWATLAGLTGQALMSSDRLMDLGEDRVDLLRRVYPATDIRPLDLFPANRYKRIWDLKVNHLGRQYDVVGIFNFDAQKADQVYLKWKDLGLPEDCPVHVFDFWNKEYLGAWKVGMAVPTAPASCRVLTLLPATSHIELISTSRHITQGPVDLATLTNDPANESFKGTSRLIKNDPYQLSFVFPCGTNFVVTRTVARSGMHRLPVQISNHQSWATLTFKSPVTRLVSWEVYFGASHLYDFPTGEPGDVVATRTGLEGVKLTWQEQYYLNAGYQVYLNGKLWGYTPEASFKIRGLDPHKAYEAEVRSVSVGGKESRRGGEVRFILADMLPGQLPLTELTPAHVTGDWDGQEIESQLAVAPVTVAGATFDHGLTSFADSEEEFDLLGLYKNFNVRVGVDDRSSGNAAAKFQIFGDGRELWHSEVIKKMNQPISVSLSIGGVKKLTLKSRQMASDSERTEIDWIEPMLSQGPR